MHKLLFSSAILISCLVNLPAHGATWWLVALTEGVRTYITANTFLIPMESQGQCEEAGAKLEASSHGGRLKKSGQRIQYECVLGK